MNIHDLSRYIALKADVYQRVSEITKLLRPQGAADPEDITIGDNMVLSWVIYHDGFGHNIECPYAVFVADNLEEVLVPKLQAMCVDLVESGNYSEWPTLINEVLVKVATDDKLEGEW